MSINNGSTFFIDVPVFSVIGGTVVQTSGGDVVGGSIVVSNDGHFINGIGGGSVGLYGNFSQLSDGSFSLAGNTRLSGTFGPISGPVNVSNTNNRIEGNAFFQHPVTLLDTNTTLTLAVSNVVNQPIYLNGGTLVLDEDISLGYGGRVVGPGVVDGQGVGSLRFSGTSDQWSSALIFRNIHTIGLSGETKLTGSWRFEGESNLVGGGSGLDFRGLGVFEVAPNAILKLSGVQLINLVQSSLCLAPTSTIVLSDVNLSTSLTMTMSSGTYLVKSASTLSVGLNDISFTGSSILQVDRATLWLDGADSSGSTLFQGDSSFNIRKVNGGTIRQATDQDHISSTSSRRLLSGSVFGDITLTENISLKPNQTITYSASALLDGNGASILFSKGGIGQFNISTGLTVNLRSINLTRLSNNTMRIASGGTVNLENDVLWELDQDITLTTGRFVMTGATDVLRIRGNGGRKKLTLAPQDDNFLFSISSNTVLLEDIEFVGIENVRYSFTTDSSTNRIVGVVGLMGTSVVDVTRDTNMSLLVNGRDSGLVLLANNVTLSGAVLFGLAPENVLNIMFALQSGAELPNVSFADGFCSMTSLGGNAGINFLNDQVTLNLLREKSMTAGERSFLSGKAVIITTNPIRVASTQFTLRQGTDLSPSGMPNPINLITTREPTLFDDLGGAALSAYQLSALKLIRTEAEENYHSYLNECARIRSLETRGRITLPTPTVRVMGRMALSRGIGDIALTAGGSVHKFLPDNWVPFSVSLTGGSRLEQRRVRTLVPIPLRDTADLQIASDGTFAGVKETDTLYVTKGQNVVAVSSDFNILGNVSIDEGAELVFELSNGAMLTFGKYQEGVTPSWDAGLPLGYQLTLPKNSTIRFTGNGSVRFADGSEIICQGSTIENNISIENRRLYNDDRPEMVVSNYAQLSVADHRRLAIRGRAKINVTTNGEINVADGKLTLGSADSDYFDLNVTRHGFIRASVPRSLTSTNYTPAARLVLNQGFFNLLFAERSAFEVGDRGLVEVSLNNNVQTRAFVNTWTFATQGCLTISAGGILSFGSNRYAPAGDSNVILPITWDNRGGEAIGGGVIRAVDGTVSGGQILFQAVLQKSFFETSTSTNVDIVKSLSRVTPSFVGAFDYKLLDGTYVVRMASGSVATLQTGDVLLSEDLRAGTVSGIQFDGRRFTLSSSGTRLVANPVL